MAAAGGAGIHPARKFIYHCDHRGLRWRSHPEDRNGVRGNDEWGNQLEENVLPAPANRLPGQLAMRSGLTITGTGTYDPLQGILHRPIGLGGMEPV